MYDAVWKFLEDNLVWAGPTGILALVFGLRKLRLWIVSLRKKPEETGYPTTDKAEAPEVKPDHGPEPDPMYVQAPPPPAVPENPIEAYYKENRRVLADAEREISLVNQKAQFEAVEKNNPQLVTIYDPYDVTPDQPIARTEDFPLDDSRRQVDSGHAAAGEQGEVVILDYRSSPDEMAPGFKPLPFRERYKLKAAARRAAIKGGAIKTARPDGHSGPVVITSTDPKTQADIEKHQEYRERVASQAEKDFLELLPQIKADAEKLAREKFVPPRMEEFKREAEERGVPVDQVVDEFVRKVGEDAGWAAEARFKKAGPLDESNPLLRKLTPERMRQAGAWQY